MKKVLSALILAIALVAGVGSVSWGNEPSTEGTWEGTWEGLDAVGVWE